MWVVEACFEGNEEPYKKLLKPGKRYQIGRKAPAQLILAEKTVSQDAGFLEVQAWAPPVQSLKDANRLPAWPMLHLHVGKKVIRAIPRDDQAHWEANRDTFIGEEAQPSAVREMADGEHIVVSRSAPPMRILWVPMMFCVSPGVVADIVLREQHQSLAPLGIAIVEAETLDPNCTHFVINATSPTAPFLDALVSCVHIVTGDYIAELIRADANEDGGTTSTLELEYTLPDAQEYFPPNDSDLDSTTYEEVKSKSPPDERRKSIFSGITILFASTDETSKAAFKAREPVFFAAGARIETVAPSLFARLGDEEKVERYLQAKLGAAKTRAEQLASPGVSTNQMVIIASAPVQPPEAWHTLFAKVSRKLKIPMPHDGIDALSQSVMLTAPARFLKRLAPEPEEDESFSQAVTEQCAEENDESSSPRNESGQRDDMPPPAQQNQAPALRVSGEEDSLQQPSVPQTQVQPTQASTVAPTTPSRRPKRRAGIERADPFADLFGSSASAVDSAMPPPAAESQASEVGATQISPSRGGAAGSIRGLRRNVTAAKEQPRRSDVWRSIFEDSTPSASSTGQSSNDGAHNATQGGSTQERYTKRFRMELDAVDQRESQRENQGASQQTSADPDVTMRPSTEQTQRPAENGRKRRAEEDAEDERDVVEVTQRAEAAAPEAVPSATPAAEDATPTNAKDGAAKSSTQAKTLGSDAKFLQSIASMKSTKGKKQVDPLDKEFDRLRIVRPNHGPAASGKNGGTQATTLVGQASVEDAEYRAWQDMTMDDFDVGAAGKFIQVDFVPLVRQRTSGGANESTAADRSTDTQGSWAGRPNFKKFRAKERDRSQPVPLVLHVIKGKDSATGQMYDVDAIKGARQRVTQARTDAASSAKATQSATQKKKSIFAKESDEEEENTGRGSRSKSGRAPTRGAAESWGMTSARPRVRSTGSHEDDEDGRSSRSKTPVKLSGTKKANTVVDVRLDIDGDPMDDNDVFSDDDGGGRQSRAARKRKQPTQMSRKKEARGVVVVVDSDDEEEDQIVDEDSDRDYGFQGFKRKRTQGTSRK